MDKNTRDLITFAGILGAVLVIFYYVHKDASTVINAPGNAANTAINEINTIGKTVNNDVMGLVGGFAMAANNLGAIPGNVINGMYNLIGGLHL